MGGATGEDGTKFSQKIKNRTDISSSSLASGYLSRKMRASVVSGEGGSLILEKPKIQSR